MLQHKNKRWIYLLAILSLLIGGFIYYTFDPSAKGTFFPRCLFLQLTGYKCPGCGSQRALHALLHGDLQEVFSQNAFLLISIPVVLFLFVAKWQRFHHPKLYHFATSRWVIYPLLIATIAWWIGRNIC